jgi:aspartate-semialdehyde dehydrogenase
MPSEGLRLGIAGATGALGGEVLAVLDESPLRIADLVLLATDRSLGTEVEFQGNGYPVQAEVPSLRGLDLLFLCAPGEASLELARQALHAEVPCIDLSGALSTSDEVPLRVAAFGPPPEGEAHPLVATPSGSALTWALVLRPLAEQAGLRRVLGTVLETASSAGRAGVEALYAESLALFNQDDPPELETFGRPIAFDCLPAAGALGEDGATDGEEALMRTLGRLLDAKVKISATAVQVPVFVGQGSVLAIETEQPLDPKQAEALLAKAPGVEVWEDNADGLTTRAASGRDEALVGRVRRDPSCENGLLLWVASDVLRLAASNAVALAVSRLHAH